MRVVINSIVWLLAAGPPLAIVMAMVITELQPEPPFYCAQTSEHGLYVCLQPSTGKHWMEVR